VIQKSVFKALGDCADTLPEAEAVPETVCRAERPLKVRLVHADPLHRFRSIAGREEEPRTLHDSMIETNNARRKNSTARRSFNLPTNKSLRGEHGRVDVDMLAPNYSFVSAQGKLDLPAWAYVSHIMDVTLDDLYAELPQEVVQGGLRFLLRR